MAVSSRAHIPSVWLVSFLPNSQLRHHYPSHIVFPQETSLWRLPTPTHAHALRKALVCPQNSTVCLPSPHLRAFWAWRLWSGLGLWEEPFLTTLKQGLTCSRSQVLDALSVASICYTLCPQQSTLHMPVQGWAPRNCPLSC